MTRMPIEKHGTIGVRGHWEAESQRGDVILIAKEGCVLDNFAFAEPMLYPDPKAPEAIDEDHETLERCFKHSTKCPDASSLVTSSQVTPVMKLIISIARDLFVVTTLATGSLVATVSATEPPITDVAFSPDGKTVIGVSQTGLEEFRFPELTLIRTIATSSANLHCLTFSPDETKLAVGGGHPAEDGSVEIFSWPAAESITELKGHRDSVRSVVWQDGHRIVSASVDRDIRLWNLNTDPPFSQALSGHSRSVDSICLLPDRKTLVSAGVDQSLRVWDLDGGVLIRSLNQHTKPVQALALSPAESGLPMIASAAADRTIRFWQPTIGRLMRYVRLDVEPLDVAWLNDSHVVAACVDGKIRIVDTENVVVLQVLPVLEGWAYSLAIHPGSSDVVVGGRNGQLRRVTVDLSQE